MAENKISYTARNFDDYKREIRELTRKYYPDVFASLNDASIGEWLIELVSDVGDNLSFHTDRVFQETNIESAREKTSLNNLARANGLKMPGNKAAVVELEFSCEIPLNDSNNEATMGRLSTPDENYCPYIRRGTLVSNGAVTFELTEDVDFKEQFNADGISNREIIPVRDSNGNVYSYLYKKLAIGVAAQSKIYKMTIQSTDLKPFMDITLKDANIVGVESIIVKQGASLNSDPSMAEFYVDEETYYDYNGKPVQRYFEVENLIDQYRFGYVVEKTPYGTPVEKDDMEGYRNYYNPVWYTSDRFDVVDEEGSITDTIDLRQVAKGQWKRLKNKFVTEYTDDGGLKITFGPGIRNQYGEIPEDAKYFTQYMMSRMYANDYMGVIPEANSTLYVLYRVGGGEISNVAAKTINYFISLLSNVEGNAGDRNCTRKIRAVKDSLRVTNPTISYGGKDAPNVEEMRYLIKYNNSAQNRCVTLNDYYAVLSRIPAKYGLPFKMGIIEENNKIVVYTLGLDPQGKLTNILSETVAENMKEYLKMYKMVNDFVEIKSGRIINIGFQVTVYVDKAYDKGEVVQRIMNKITDYMDIRRHQMGEDIYLGDLQKEITKMDGVIQLVNLSVINKTGEGYSDDLSTQEFVDRSVPSVEYGWDAESDEDDVNNEIDLEASDYILFSEANSMHEIKYKEKDIIVITKVR